jgi:class 3 adenylate cyclase
MLAITNIARERIRPLMAFGHLSKGEGISEMEAPPLERRLAAILAADVEGYSRLMHGDEEATMVALSARRALVDELIARHRGRIANTAGDSVLAEFASVLDAIRCAVEIQAALERANEGEPKERWMRFRIGVNVGDVMVKDGDIFGDGVNVAARLEGLVKGGEICVSRGVHDHLRHRSGISFEDLGEQLVKNIAHPIRAFRLRIGESTSGQVTSSPEETAVEPELPSAPATVSELSADTEVALELALWDSVKEGSPAELESYLEQYPDGTFASLARTRIDAALHSTPERAAPATAEAAADPLDLAFWESVKDSNRCEELQAYLDQHPTGHFAALARARLSSPDVT